MQLERYIPIERFIPIAIGAFVVVTLIVTGLLISESNDEVRSVTCRHAVTGEVVFNGLLQNVRHKDNYVTGMLEGKRIIIDGQCTTHVKD
jgi:hypothetical protein